MAVSNFLESKILGQNHLGSLQAIYSENEKNWKISLVSGEKEMDFPFSKINFKGFSPNSLQGFSIQTLAEDFFSIDFEVIEGELHLDVKSKDFFSVRVNYGTSVEHFAVNSKEKGFELAQFIREKWGLSDFGVFTFEGELDLDQTLEQQAISENSVLNIEIKEEEKRKNLSSFHEHGLGTAPLPFVGFNNEVEVNLNQSESWIPVKCQVIFRKLWTGAALLPIENWSEELHTWRKIIPGLNLLGECKNPNCEARKINQKVCIPLGIGTFNMGEQCSVGACSCCGEKGGTFNNCVFWDCIYLIEGEKEKAGKGSYNSGRRIAPSENAVTFIDKKDLETWEHLKISTFKNSSCVLI